jgi:TPR repeat protein
MRKRLILLFIATVTAGLLGTGFLLSPIESSMEMRHRWAMRADLGHETRKAELLYRTLIWNGDDAAANNLGTMIEISKFARGNRDRVEQIEEQARGWYRGPADRRVAAAIYNIGMQYYRMRDDPARYEEGKQWLCQRGGLDELTALSCALHLSGTPGHPDRKDKLRRLSAILESRSTLQPFDPSLWPYAHAEMGHLHAQTNREASLEHYRLAADAGILPAMEHLAFGLLNGPSPPTTDWLAQMKKAAANPLSVPANAMLGKAYKYGLHGLPINGEKAIYFLKRAASISMPRPPDRRERLAGSPREGFRTGRPTLDWMPNIGGTEDAAYELGTLYADGDLTPRDIDAARLYLGVAAREKWKDAELRLQALDRDPIQINLRQ